MRVIYPRLMITGNGTWKKDASWFRVRSICGRNMEGKEKFRTDPSLRLMDQVRQVPRYHHYAYRTEHTYCDWILRFIKLHGCKTHPKDMSKTEIDSFLITAP